MEDIIAFRGSKHPYGWMSNMAGGYPIQYKGRTYPSTEHLFQFGRLKDGNESMIAKWCTMPAGKMKRAFKPWLQRNPDQLKYKMLSTEDLDFMRKCVRLKLEQHPKLIYDLLLTDDKAIIEDVTNRGASLSGSNLFWGKGLILTDDPKVESSWVGQNRLGFIWQEMRQKYDIILRKEVEWYRAGTTSLSTVKILHIPTNITVSAEEIECESLSMFKKRKALYKKLIKKLKEQGTYFKVTFAEE